MHVQRHVHTNSHMTTRQNLDEEFFPISAHSAHLLHLLTNKWKHAHIRHRSLSVATYLRLRCCAYFPEDNSAEPIGAVTHVDTSMQPFTTETPAQWLFSLALQSVTHTQTHRLYTHAVNSQKHKDTHRGKLSCLILPSHTCIHTHTHSSLHFNLQGRQNLWVIYFKPFPRGFYGTEPVLNLITAFAFYVSNLWILPLSLSLSGCACVYASKLMKDGERGGWWEETWRGGDTGRTNWHRDECIL